MSPTPTILPTFRAATALTPATALEPLCFRLLQPRALPV